jgi:uncharacterized membrane protein
MKSPMNWRLKVAFTCFLLSMLTSIIFALTYLLRSEFMPYHAAAVGQSWAEVDPAFQILILALMKVAAGGWLAAAFATGILLFIPFRRGMRWAYFSIPIIGLSTSLTTLYASLYVARNTPASPPWMAAALATILLMVGFIFSVMPEEKAKQEEKRGKEY